MKRGGLQVHLEGAASHILQRFPNFTFEVNPKWSSLLFCYALHVSIFIQSDKVLLMQTDYFLSAASHWKHLTSKTWVNFYLELPVRLDTGNTTTCTVKLASQPLHVFVEQNSISAFVDTGSILNVCGSSFTPSVKVTSVEQEQTCWMNRYKQQGTIFLIP